MAPAGNQLSDSSWQVTTASPLSPSYSTRFHRLPPPPRAEISLTFNARFGFTRARGGCPPPPLPCSQREKFRRDGPCVRLIMIDETFSRSLRCCATNKTDTTTLVMLDRATTALGMERGAAQQEHDTNLSEHDEQQCFGSSGRTICASMPADVARHPHDEHDFLVPARPSPLAAYPSLLTGVRDNGSLGCKGRARLAKEVPHGRPGRIADAPLCIVKLS